MRSFWRLGLVAALVLLFVVPSVLLAQETCLNIRMIGQARLPAPELLRENDSWGGEVVAMITGEPGPLLGKFSGTDGDVIWRRVIGMGKDGSYRFDFGEAGTFTTHVTNAVYPITPAKLGFGYYQAAHKIAEGTGRFQYATGNLLIAGTYLAWPLGDPNDPNTPWTGRWNPDISGKICNIAP